MNYLQNISQLAYDGFREFTERPLKHSLDALKDYWDIVPAVVLGLSWGEYGDALFGDYRGLAMIGGPFLGVIPAKIMESSDETKGDRWSRNFATYGASAFISADISDQSPLFLEVSNKLLELFVLAGIWAGEHERRRHRLEEIVA